MEEMTIGQVARKCCVNVETIRFYERKGLIERPAQPVTGYRKYPPETAVRVRFIRNAKNLGFSLREIRDLLSLATERRRRCAETRAMAEGKIAEIDRKVKALLGMREELSILVDACRRGTRDSGCPILVALGERAVGSDTLKVNRKE